MFVFVKGRFTPGFNDDLNEESYERIDSFIFKISL